MNETAYDRWISRDTREDEIEQGETCDLLGGEICPYTSCDYCPANRTGEIV